MRSKFLWLGFTAALAAALAIADGGGAQAPGKKGPPFGRKGGPFSRRISADQIVERVLSFDKNDDGKVTMEELPERMQHLIALGDVNKDGALDKEEIRKLATTLEAFAGLTSGIGPGPFAGGPPPAGGPKGGGPKGGGPKGGGPKGGGLKGGGEVQRTLDELNLTGKTRDKAQSVARAHQDKLRRFDELTRAEVILQMKDVLNEEDYRVFKSALDRRPGRPGFGGLRQPDLDRRIDQLQKELDDLRLKVSK